MEDTRIEAEARGCSIDLFVKGNVTWPGDRELLHRAVENVPRNAIHHSPNGACLDVDAAAEDGHAVI